jgi:hypothetical protein
MYQCMDIATLYPFTSWWSVGLLLRLNNMNKNAQVFMKRHILICLLEVEFLDHMAPPYLNLKVPTLFSYRVISFSITQSMWLSDILFLATLILVLICIYLLLVKLRSLCLLIGHLFISSGKHLFRDFIIFNWIVCSFLKLKKL